MTDDTNDVRAALGTLTSDVTVSPSLVGDGLARGRRLRRRRRVVAAAGGIASVAVLAAGVLTQGSVLRDGGAPRAVYEDVAAGRAFRVVATRDGEWVCLRASGEGVPDEASCWSASLPVDSSQTLDLGNGHALAIVGVGKDTAGVVFRPGAGETYVRTVAVRGLPGWRFAFLPYAGRPERFVPYTVPHRSD